jgi:hypothetical protein
MLSNTTYVRSMNFIEESLSGLRSKRVHPLHILIDCNDDSASSGAAVADTIFKVGADPNVSSAHF